MGGRAQARTPRPRARGGLIEASALFRFKSKSRSVDDSVALYLPSMIDGVSNMSEDPPPFAAETIHFGYRPTTIGLAGPSPSAGLMARLLR